MSRRGEEQRITSLAFYGVVLLVGYLAYRIVQPFLVEIGWAVVLAICLAPLRSRLDRASLQRIAAAGGGQYFELDRDPDRDIANTIIDAGRRQAPVTTERGTTEELYWRCLAAGLALAGAAALFVREGAALWIQLAGALGAALAAGTLIVS